MVILPLCLVVAVFPLVFSQDDRCCLPHDTFTIEKHSSYGSIVEYAAYLGVIQTVTEEVQAYDFVNGMAATHQSERFYSHPWPGRTVHLVENITANTVYYMDYNLRTCSLSTSDEYEHLLRKCIPEQAQLLRKSHFGHKSHYGETWTIPNSNHTRYTGFQTVTIGDDCVPLVDTAIGTVNAFLQGNQQTVRSGLYQNYTVGIEDPLYFFTVPTWCTDYLAEQERQRQEQEANAGQEGEGEAPTQAPQAPQAGDDDDDDENGGSRETVYYLPLLTMLIAFVLRL